MLRPPFSSNCGLQCKPGSQRSHPKTFLDLGIITQHSFSCGIFISSNSETVPNHPFATFLLPSYFRVTFFLLYFSLNISSMPPSIFLSIPIHFPPTDKEPVKETTLFSERARAQSWCLEGSSASDWLELSKVQRQPRQVPKTVSLMGWSSQA